MQQTPLDIQDEDLRLLTTMKQLNPAFSLSPAARRSLQRLVDSKLAESRNARNRLREPAQTNNQVAGAEFVDLETNFNNELEDMRERLTLMESRSVSTRGTIAAFLTWDVRFDSEMSNNEFMLMMLLGSLFFFLLIDTFMYRFEH